MTATPTCKPWCTDHKSADECYTRFTIYDDGREESAKPDPDSLAGQFAALGGFPGQVSWISFVACQEDEDENPVMDLQFFEAGADEITCSLSLNLEQLKEFHASLGAVIRDFS